MDRREEGKVQAGSLPPLPLPLWEVEGWAKFMTAAAVCLSPYKKKEDGEVERGKPI